MEYEVRNIRNEKWKLITDKGAYKYIQSCIDNDPDFLKKILKNSDQQKKLKKQMRIMDLCLFLLMLIPVVYFFFVKIEWPLTGLEFILFTIGSLSFMFLTTARN